MLAHPIYSHIHRSNGEDTDTIQLIIDDKDEDSNNLFRNINDCPTRVLHIVHLRNLIRG